MAIFDPAAAEQNFEDRFGAGHPEYDYSNPAGMQWEMFQKLLAAHTGGAQGLGQYTPAFGSATDPAAPGYASYLTRPIAAPPPVNDPATLAALKKAAKA
jgi:hypothetical protein